MSLTYSELYAQRFAVYTRRTDGKEILAAKISDIVRSRGRQSLLDIGAGNGLLSSALKSSFSRVSVVERKEELSSELSSMGFYAVFVQSAETLDFAAIDFDTVLLSYVVNGIDDSALKNIFDFMRNKLSEPPLVLLCTESSQSPWSSFAAEVCKLIDIPRAGGVDKDVLKVRGAGAIPVLLQDVQTHIFAPSVMELAETLSCFFLRHAGLYDTNINVIAEKLERYVVQEKGKIVLPVQEEIYEVEL